MSSHVIDRPAAAQASAARLRGWLKTPILLSVFAAVSLIFFGILGYAGQTSTFHIATGKDYFQIAPLAVPSMAACMLLSILCVLAAAASFHQGLRGQKTPTWLIVSFGVAWFFSFLVWVTAGQTMPFIGLMQTGLVLAVPLIFGAMSGVLCERSGTINIAIEGQLLLGAFGATVVASLTQNPYFGIMAAPVFGLLIGWLLALFTVKYAVNQLIVGVVLNVFALGLTSFLFGSLLSDNASLLNSPNPLPRLPVPLLSSIPVIGPILFNQSLLIYLMYIAVAAVHIMLFRSRWGLRMRSVGEHPQAADTVGINVNRTRWRNVLLGSMVAGLGGAVFTIGAGVAFTEDISAGKGYIALAAMILGKWRPTGALAAALLFGVADSLQLQLGILQTNLPDDFDKVAVPTEFMSMLPYLITIFAVAGLVGKVRAPAAEGHAYIKE